jgi:hypothetical protein
MECLVFFYLQKRKDSGMSMVKSVWEIQDLDLLVRVTWNTVGVIESGRIRCDSKS